MEITDQMLDEIIERLEARWSDQGMCQSCGWHELLYLHLRDAGIGRWNLQDALENNEGVLKLPCQNQDAGEDRFSHRGVRIFIGPEEKKAPREIGEKPECVKWEKK